MIQKKRINNDVFVRWGVFTPEGLPVDLTEVTSITIEARPQSSNGRYPMVSEVVDNFVEAYFLSKDQKVVGKYNLYLTYTIDDPNIIGGVATYTIDYCDAFELLPKSCFVDGEDDVDPVNIQGIIASFTYSMLTEEEKNDLASRLSGNSGAQNLSDLLDVTISNLEIDQILKYDGTKWVNATPTGDSSSNVSWGIPTSQYTPLTVNGVTRNLSLNNHTHPWDTITNRPLTDEQFQDLLEIAGLWKLDNDGNLYTERNVYSHGEVSAYNWGESPTPPGGVYNLKDLLDVGIINPQEDNILRFNGSHWVNVPSSNVGTLVEWSSETDNYVNLSVGDSSKSISLHGHKHEIEDINNLQNSLDFKQDSIPLGDISQYYRGDKEWAALNTDTVVEATNLYYTPERVIELTGGLYAQKDHTHAFNSLTGLPNTLDGYGIIDAYNKTEIDNLISSTSGFWVKSVGLEAPTGFTVSNSPIIYEGNIKLSFASGYSLPSDSKQYNWDLAFSDRHTHTNISVLNELTIDDVNNWNSIQEHLNDYNNPHQVSFKQLINKPNTLLGYGITDVYNKTEVDYIFSNITPGEPTIKNVYGYDSIGQSFNNDTLSDTFNAYTISRLHDRLTILEQGDTDPGDADLDTIINWYNNIGRYWLLDANNDALYTNKNVYSTQEISAYGYGGSGGGGGAGALYELSDVALTNLQVNDIIRFNGTHWVNIPQSSVGTQVSWGSLSSGYRTLTVGGVSYALATDSHMHTIADVTNLQTELDSKWTTDFNKIADWDTSYTASHSHDNKAVIDQLTQTHIEVLSKLFLDGDDNLYTTENFYSHGEISAYGYGGSGGGGGDGSHVEWGVTSNNYSPLIVEGVSKTVALQGHTHTKAQITDFAHNHVISDITGLQTEIAKIPTLSKQGQWDTAYTQSHTHSNKNVLDGITSELITNWNTAFTDSHTHNNKSQLDLITQVHINVLNKLFLDSNGNLFTTENFYSEKELSAYGYGGSGGGSGGVGALYELSDTSVDSRVTGDILIYNGTHWENRPQSSIVPDLTGYALESWVSSNFSPIGHTHNYIPLSQKGSSNGVAELDETGHVPASQLPSYVDDVLEFSNQASFPLTGETGKIYVALDSNLTYRWSGSGYVEISPSLALGETSSTAYRGDRGKIAYDHSQVTGNPHNTTFAQLGSKPTTLSGFGITDAVTSTVFDNHKNNINDEKHLTQAQLTNLINLSNWWKWDETNQAVYTEENVYSEKEISAYGFGSGGTGPGGSYAEWKPTINNYAELLVEGVTKNVALSGHTHNWTDINNTPDTLLGYGIDNAYTKTQVDNLLSNLSDGTVKSVGLSAPTGFSVSNSPVTGTGVLALSFVTGHRLFTTEEADKLSGIEAGAQVNVPTNLAQGTRTATTVPVTSSTGNTATLQAVTTSLAGVMSAADKTKLDGIAANANNYVHPNDGGGSISTALTGASVISRLVVNTLGHVTATATRNLTKGNIGLGNVDNTSDINKPISTATQNALDLKLDESIFEDLFEKVEISAGVHAIKAKYDFFGVGEVAAYGFGSGGGSGSGGALYDLSDVIIPNRTTGDLLVYNGTHWTNQPQSSIIPNLTGYATESWSDNRFALKSHSHIIGDVTGLQTELDNKFNNPTGTTAQYLRGNGTLATFPTLMSAAELTTGTVTTARLISAERLNTWLNSKGYITSYVDTTYSAGTGLSLTGTTFGQSITTSGSGSFVTSITQTANGFQVNLGTPPNTTYTTGTLAHLNTGTDTTARLQTAKNLNDWLNAKNYLTGNQTVSLTGDVTGSGTTSIATSIAATVVTGKALTGYTVGTNTALTATDTILSAFRKVQAQINARGGTVTSVTITTPTGLTVSGSPITTSGTLAIGLQSGYSIPTTAKQTQWDTAYGWGDYRNYGIGRTTANAYTGGDVDVDVATGLYSTVASSTANTPIFASSGSLIMLQSGASGNAYKSQIWVKGNANTDNQLFFRHRRGSSGWNSWDEIYHTGNLTSLSQLTDNIGVASHIANSTIHITSTERTNWNTAYTQRHTHGNKTVIDKLTQGNIDVLGKLSIDASGNLKIDTNAYATGELSAYGYGGSGGSSGGIIETVYGYSNLGQTFNNATLTDTFNAYTINQINNRLLSVEGGSATGVTTSGTGDVLVSVTKSGNNIAFTKGNQSWTNLTGKPSTFVPSAHTHPFTEITGTATTAQIPNLPTSKITSGVFATARLGTGTPSSANYLRGDGTWAAITSANNGTLTLATGTGLSGSATFTANQSSNSTFTVSPIFGTTSGTIAQGNDSRINNGQTAFGWGNHATQGYFKYISSLGDESIDNITVSGFYQQGTSASASVANNYPNGAVAGMLRHYNHSTYKEQYYSNRVGDKTWYRTFYSTWSDWVEFIHSGNLDSYANSLLTGFVPTSRTLTAGNGLSGGGNLTANRTFTLGTPSAITLSSTNSVTTSSHTHAFTPGGTTSQYIRGDGSLATYANTTYSAGTGLSLSGTTFGQAITTSGSGSFVTGITQTTSGFQVNLGTPPNTTYSAGTLALLQAGTNTSNRVWSAKILNDFTDGKYLQLSGGTLTGDVIAPSFQGSISTPSGVEYLTTLNTAITAAGWYRVFVSNTSNGHGSSVILNVNRSYSTTSNESYTFSINVAYNGAISITQLSGRAVVRGISKIRVDYVNSGVLAVDIYYSLDTRNTVYISGSGTGKFQVPALVAAPTGTTVEFDTVNGVKNNLGFTGDLTGNASSATTATKLGTATVGSTQLPIYLNAGTATAITRANLRIGLFGATAIGSTTRPIYIAANGVPTAITGSIANSTTGSAATLTTTRTIWGQNFNGSANVSGAITGATTGTFSGVVTASNFVSTATAGFMLTGAKSTWANAIGTASGGGLALLTNGLTLTQANTQIYLAANGNTRIGRNATDPAHTLDVFGTGRYSGNVTAPTFIGALTGNADSATNLSRSVVAGNGLTGGGVLNANRTLTLGTPSAITLSSTNSVAASSHAHSLALGGTASQYLNGATALVTIPTITAGNGLSGGGQLTATRTLTLGTPSTLTNATTNAVAATSHTHAITTTTVGAANTIVATDASGAIQSPAFKLGNGWSLIAVGTETQLQYNGVVRLRLTNAGLFEITGDIVSTGEVTAFN